MRNQIRYIVAGVVVVVAVVVIIALHGSPKKSATPTTTTTTKPTGPIAPLSGLPDPSGTALKRPALVVKVENDPNAYPQWGVDQADDVYEEIVNGGITRLAAIFNQNAPAKVGPVRSVRPTDTQIVWPLGGIFAFSGGAQYAINSISTAPVKLVDEGTADTLGAMYRDPNRVPPYNLYGIVSKLFQFGGKPTPPPALFSYRKIGQAAVGTPVTQLTVPFPSYYAVTWKWDTKSHSWDRYMNFTGKPVLDTTGTGAIESPKNIVVMYVYYENGVGTEASYANLQVSGPAYFFTDGKEITGSWVRPGRDKSRVIVYRNSKGQTIRLTPGQTWVELMDKGGPALSVTH